MSVSASWLVERSWPYIGALTLVGGWYAAGMPFPATPDGLFGASATVASVFASFLGVSKAIILSIKGTEIYKALEKLKYTEDLFGYLRAGIWASVLFATLSILGFFVDHERMVFGYRAYSVFAALWVGAGSLSLLTHLRITNILFKLLKQV